MLKDSYGRQIKDLRISVTDRCNFRCFYCKSATLLSYKNREEILTYEEIERLARLFLNLGIRKIRITGGEPLLRRGVEQLIARIACLADVQDLALTTNGFNLYQKAQILREAGLHRVTISLDSMKKERFEAITRSKDFDKVLKSVEAAKQWDLEPIKINCVVVRGINDDEILDFAEFARSWDLTVRFIEFMPIDEDEDWSQDRVVTGAEILEILQTRYQMVPRGLVEPSATARNFDFADGRGRIGLIMPVSQPFCGQCSRIRLTADGKIRTCLFSLIEHDIKSLLREGADDSVLTEFIQDTVVKKEAGHRINEPDFVPPPRTMSYIGG
ncbi:GTP 3',8-cyclase MoaA [Acidobacteria bacterium AH-259-O06]|nr:GTP 3',8-cyclase MoaA [Acidobacteria bacterium AH-259-O06]